MDYQYILTLMNSRVLAFCCVNAGVFICGGIIEVSSIVDASSHTTAAK